MLRVRPKLPLLLSALVLACLARPDTAAAQATAVAEPASFEIALGRATPPPLRVVWRTTGTAGPVVSFGGRVFLDDAAQTTIQTLPGLPPQPGLVGTFPETIRLSAADVQRAVQAGVRRILVVRNFKIEAVIPPPDLRSAVAVISLTSSLGAGFSVTRIQLRLGEGSPVSLFQRGDVVSAWADLSYGGTGEIEAIWELAEPASSAGVPVYRPLRRVNRVLGAGQRVSLPAPELPSDQTGLYLLRLRVLDPAPGFELPVLRYYVSPEDEAPPELGGIVILGPDHGVELQAGTTFSWRPLAAARAYRVELHPGGDAARRTSVHFDPESPGYADIGGLSRLARPYETGLPLGAEPPPLSPEPGLLEMSPTAAILVPGGRGSARLTPVVRARLRAGETYLWIVRALGAESVPVGMSAPRLIHVPGETP